MFIPFCEAHHESVATHVRRPNFGTAGQRYTVQVNSFEVTVPEIYIFHYDGKSLMCYAQYWSLNPLISLVPSW